MYNNFIIIAMKRSGQHGVINWLGCQSKNNTLHFNHCIRGWKNKEFKPMRDNFVVYYDNKNNNIKNYFFDHKINPNKNRMLNQELKNDTFKDVDFKMYNIEDLSLTKYIQNGMDDFKQVKDNGKVIIILRDPFNFIASCLQRKINPPDAGATDVADNIKKRLDVWVEHAKEACGETNKIDGTYFISYNDWFISEEYREKICEDLGIDFTDNGLNKVINYGSGSSFDREKYDGNAQKMKIMDRWENFKDNEKFNKLLSPEIIRLSEKIFNFNPLK